MLLHTIDPAKALDDDMPVQCLPVYQADNPQWTYRRVPKVSSSRSFSRIPSWCRKPQSFTYHVCAEDLTKTAIVPSGLGRGGSYFSRVVSKRPILCDVPSQKRVSKVASMFLMQQLVSLRLQLSNSLGQNMSMSYSNP